MRRRPRLLVPQSFKCNEKTRDWCVLFFSQPGIKIQIFNYSEDNHHRYALEERLVQGGFGRYTSIWRFLEFEAFYRWENVIKCHSWYLIIHPQKCSSSCSSATMVMIPKVSATAKSTGLQNSHSSSPHPRISLGNSLGIAQIKKTN